MQPKELDYFRGWRAENRDHLNAYHRARYAKQREKILAYQLLWAKLNRAKKNAYQQKYRDRKRRGLVGRGRGL